MMAIIKGSSIIYNFDRKLYLYIEYLIQILHHYIQNLVCCYLKGLCC